MTNQDIVRKSLDLHAEWMKYVFENPDVLDRIPKNAVLVIRKSQISKSLQHKPIAGFRERFLKTPEQIKGILKEDK